MTVHLVTGVTGFVGAALACELLEEPDAELVCLARRKRDEQSASERVRAKLELAHAYYGYGPLGDDRWQRVRVLDYDLAASAASQAKDLPAMDCAWHCAASLKFKARDAAEIAAHNVQGTERLLELARQAGADAFNYVSTAYVAGKRTGTIREERFADETLANNAYEASKVQAERIVGDTRGIATRIMRPSVVIGHSQTYAALSHVGLYGLVLGLLGLQREVREQLGDFLGVRPLQTRARPEATINLIPIDRVVRAAARIGRSGSDGRVYHLVNTAPPTIATAAGAVFETLGLAPPKFVSDDDRFTSIDRRFHEDGRTRFFMDYISSERSFDASNVVDVMGAGALEVPLSKSVLSRHVEWYVGHLTDRYSTSAASSSAIAGDAASKPNGSPASGRTAAPAS